MSLKVLDVILVFLVILVLALVIAVFAFQIRLHTCEKNESPYCLEYVCPSGMSATRVNDKGQTIASGSNAVIPDSNSNSGSS